MKKMIGLPDAGENGIYFRKEFYMEELPEKAILRMSALGIYKGYLNGHALDQQIFLPGRTSYSYRVQYQEYDVTNQLLSGNNVIAAILSRGWYKKEPKLHAELTLSYADSEETIISDDSWKACSHGPLGFHDMKQGELYDARKEMPGWEQIEFSDSSWKTPVMTEYNGNFVPAQGEKILEHERFIPQKILKTPDGSVVLDFGQNIAGYMEFTVTGHEGTHVSMIHGETLDAAGNFTQKNLNFTKNKKTGQFPQTVSYILKDGTQTYKPMASVHGFQYVKLTNWPEEVKKENFTAIAVYSDLKQTGQFHCSNDKINQLVSNCRWSMKGNFLDVPTDCPTRERAGWTGDIMVYSIPATYQMDTYLFLKKWLQDVILEQGEDGRIKNIVPDGDLPSFMDGAAGWSDVIVKLPFILYQFYGNKEILEMAYPAIKKHISFMEKRSKKRKLWNKAKPAYHDHLIDCGFHWGEWLEPGGSMPAGALRGFTVPDMEVASAYYAWSVGKAAEIADILGKKEDATYYQSLYQKIKEAYQQEFLPGGSPKGDRQCRFVRPVALDLAKEEDKSAIVATLNEMVIANHYHVGTGFLSTPHVCRVLSDYGYADTAYKMLENEEQPGWLYEVNKGATSIWENWYGKDVQGNPKNSMNHYSPGAIIGWLYSRVAGIEPLLPGFEKVRIAPVTGGSLQEVNCVYESVAGKIHVNWKQHRKEFSMDITTPRSTEVLLPDGVKKCVDAGTYHFECTL